MKIRHVAAIPIGAGLLTWALLCCSIAGPTEVTIDQRVADFQSDLNTSDRASAYQDFSPNDNLYTALQSGSYFASVFPVPPPNYSLSVIDESNPSTGVIVQVSGPPPSGLGYSSPYFLNLTMTETSDSIWLIESLYIGSASNGGSGGWVLEYH
jgi:hypothetical protein